MDLFPQVESGTANYVPLWSDSDTLGNSLLRQHSGGLSAFGGLSAHGDIHIKSACRIFLYAGGGNYLDYNSWKVGSGDAATINNTGAGGVDLQTGSTSRLFISGGSGKVGVGTTVPAEKLTVHGNISASGSLSAAGPNNNYFAGNVGVGTNAPLYPLVVNSAGDGIKLDITDGVDANFRVTVNGAVTEVGPSTATFALMAGGSERMRINNSGQFAMNATSFPSDSNLSVKAIASNQGVVFGENAYPTALGTNGLSVEGSVKIGGTLSAVGNINTEGDVTICGDASVCGHFSACTKAFLIDHPTKPGYKLKHGAVEAPEWGVQYRGNTDQSSITLPEYWDGLVRDDSVSTILTPVGEYQCLYVKHQDNKHVCVGGVSGCFNYVVYGERKDVDKMEVEINGV